MPRNEIKYYDNLFAHKEQGKVVIKSWVFENDTWVERELTPDESRQIKELGTKLEKEERAKLEKKEKEDK